jgi:hypothetical protein
MMCPKTTLAVRSFKREAMHNSRLMPTLYLAISIAASALGAEGLAPPTPSTPPLAAIRCDAIGDGMADDTAAIQKMLDSGAGTVYLPTPPKHYLISRPLVIHSNQTLHVDRFAVVRLKDKSDCVMIANADPDRGNENVALVGGVWDMNNLNQSFTEYQKTRRYTAQPFDPHRYLGTLMRFNNVKNLLIRGLTLKDPVTYGAHLGNVRQFTVEDITFDYNLKRSNMDGVHVNGNSRFGRIANLAGATNDDEVALNADDCGYFEMSHGPIEDVSVDGVFAENGYTAVRLLSAGSPVRRIKLANIFGAYRYNVVSFTNHRAHPGTASTFEDVSIEGVFCSRSMMGLNPLKPLNPTWAPVWIDAPAVVGSLTIRNYHRTEAIATDDIYIGSGATVRYLGLNDISIINRTNLGTALLNNKGAIETLNMANIYMRAEDGSPRGHLIDNSGRIHRKNLANVQGLNLAAEEKETH